MFLGDGITMTTLRFGKYKGYDLSEVPDDYLRWLISTQEKRLDEYRHELDRRNAMRDAKLSWAERIVQAGYRSLAMQYHPDRGGSNELMREVISAHETLKTMLNGSGLK